MGNYSIYCSHKSQWQWLNYGVIPVIQWFNFTNCRVIHLDAGLYWPTWNQIGLENEKLILSDACPIDRWIVPCLSQMFGFHYYQNFGRAEPIQDSTLKSKVYFVFWVGPILSVEMCYSVWDQWLTSWNADYPNVTPLFITPRVYTSHQTSDSSLSSAKFDRYRSVHAFWGASSH